MPRFKYLIALCLLLLTLAVPSLYAQTDFKVVLVSGTAKIQRASTRQWETMALGDAAASNDIIETFYQSKTALQYGKGSMLLIGPNTKVLLTLLENPDKTQNVTVTVFNGGVMLKAGTGSRAEIFTANAVAVIDSGVFSTVVESKTGNTGFQVLNGSAVIRNISSQGGNTLGKGLTTIVLPGREPTAPLYITYRHVAVLKHFFGEDLIKREIETAGLTPTDDAGGANRQNLSGSLQDPTLAGEDQIYKKLFSRNMIYGAVIKSAQKNSARYVPTLHALRPFDNHYEVGLEGGGALAVGGYNHLEILRGSVHGPAAAFGLRLPFSSDAERGFAIHLNSFQGFLDKIDYLDFGKANSGRYVHFGNIDKLTLGRGLLVDHFSARDLYSVTQPFGALLDLDGDNAGFKAFLGDLSAPRVGGASFTIHPGMSWMHFGYAFDGNQLASGLQASNARLISIDTLLGAAREVPSSDSAKPSAHAWEFGFGLQNSPSEEMLLGLFFQFARKQAAGGADGWIIRGPEFEIYAGKFRASISYLAENGRLHAGYFGESYMNTRRQIHAVIADTVWYETPSIMLSKNRRSAGFIIDGGFSPLLGSAIDLSIRQDFLARESFMSDNSPGEVYGTDSLTDKINYSWRLRAALDDRLVPQFKYAEIWASQSNGGLYPKGGNWFAAWGFRAGLDFLTAPLIFNIALTGGVLFSYLDLYASDQTTGVLSPGFNNNIDPGDNFFEFRLGLRWGAQ